MTKHKLLSKQTAFKGLGSKLHFGSEHITCALIHRGRTENFLFTCGDVIKNELSRTA